MSAEEITNPVSEAARTLATAQWAEHRDRLVAARRAKSPEQRKRQVEAARQAAALNTLRALSGDDFVRAVVATAPPLTELQIEAIRAVLRAAQ